MTRNSYERQPYWSRFVGTLFAGGHSVMVLAIAALIGAFGGAFHAYAESIELAGTWLSLGILFLVAGLNIVQLRAGGDVVGGVRSKALSKALRESTHILVALPVGLLFGLGFETSSQLATYAVAFASGAGALGAVAIGLAFCVGIICTDTLDSVLVHRFLARSPAAMLRAKRTWLAAVTVFALVVALYQLAQIFGWKPPVNELTISLALIVSLFAVDGYIVVRPADSADVAG